MAPHDYVTANAMVCRARLGAMIHGLLLSRQLVNLRGAPGGQVSDTGLVDVGRIRAIGRTAMPSAFSVPVPKEGLLGLVKIVCSDNLRAVGVVTPFHADARILQRLLSLLDFALQALLHLTAGFGSRHLALGQDSVNRVHLCLRFGLSD